MNERLVALALVALGGAAAVGSWRLAEGAGGMEGAALPLGISLLLVVLSLVLVVRAFAGGRRASAPPPPPGRPWAAVGLLAMLGAYALLFDPLGFVVVTPLFALAYLRLFHGVPWVRSLVTAGLTTAGGYLLFHRALGVPLHGGTWFQGLIG